MLLTYSSRVKWAKIFFPIIAIGAVIYFMSIDWSNDQKITDEFVAEDKVFQKNTANVEQPKLDITTTSGDHYKLEASAIESIDGSIQRFSGGDVKGDITIGDSHWALSADSSTADVQKETIEFNDNVTGVLDNEYTFSTDQLKAAIGAQIISGEKRVEVNGKIGQVVRTVLTSAVTR